ncbi:hypothetical protein PR048_013651, partial [Dryococelus australis]
MSNPSNSSLTTTSGSFVSYTQSRETWLRKSSWKSYNTETNMIFVWKDLFAGRNSQKCNNLPGPSLASPPQGNHHLEQNTAATNDTAHTIRVTPEDILPIPQVGLKDKGDNVGLNKPRTKRNKGKTGILTSSPYIQELRKKAPQRTKLQKLTIHQRYCPFKKNGRSKKELKTMDSESEVEDVPCRIKAREEWVKYQICSVWSHVVCTMFDTYVHFNFA